MQNPAVYVHGNGSVHIADAGMPEVLPRMALVRMLAGAVSTGTETTGMIQMRKQADPTRVPGRVGYSGAGVVESAGSDYTGPPVGSAVAVYGGPYVSHSAWCAVGQNLVSLTSLPPEEASFGGIGAIAMHAVRQAEVGLGQRVGVLGLGVLGQIVAQLARAAGAWVLVSDPLASRREIALQLGADVATTPDDYVAAASEFTHGCGLDAVLVVAGTPDSAGPAKQGLSTLRFRGRLEIVGNVKTEWLREELFQREAIVSVSRAAGPGRYDPQYERDGHDMPIGLVPWTEGRNLRCFIELLEARRVRVDSLISAVMPMSQASQAYDRLISAPNDTLGIVLRFP